MTVESCGSSFGISVCRRKCRQYPEDMAMLSGAPARLSHDIDRRLGWGSIENPAFRLDEFSLHRDLRCMRNLYRANKFVDAVDYSAYAKCLFAIGRKPEALQLLERAIEDNRAGGLLALQALTLARIVDAWETSQGDSSWRYIERYFSHRLNFAQTVLLTDFRFLVPIHYRGHVLVLKNPWLMRLGIRADWRVDVDFGFLRFATTWSDLIAEKGVNDDALLDPVVMRLQSSRKNSPIERALATILGSKMVQSLRNVRFSEKLKLKKADLETIGQLDQVLAGVGLR